jgi:hypothetical protein
VDFQLDSELGQYLYHIADNLKANRAAVLVGAGFSRNADGGSVSAPAFPTWNELADAFCAKLHPSQSQEARYLNPLALAEQVEATYGRSELDSLLMARIPDAQYQPSDLHKKLLTLPWTDVFTTNYDTLLERACQDITEKRFNLIYCKEDLVGSGDAPRVVKLHGTFPSHRPFIITAEDYRRYPQDFAPFINTVQQSLLENTLCLIGFSGDDQNFNQWLGWIQDNLGPDNSPQIYLFTHKDYPAAQKKLLYRKKVVVLNIASLAPQGNARQRYEALLDWLAEAVHMAQPIWPAVLSLGGDENKRNLPEVTRKLQDIRAAYPGWLVPPHGVRERINILRREVSFLVNSNLSQNREGELAFLYEYNWLMEKCLHPLFKYDVQLFEEALGRNPFLDPQRSGEEKQMELDLYLALLRSYREDADREGWQRLFCELKAYQKDMSDEQSHRLTYECCLFARICFDYKELQRLLDQWKADEGVPEWSLRKAGLLAEYGFCAQACELLQNSLVSIRRQLQTDDQNYRLLSLESALMSQKRYAEQAINFEKHVWIQDTTDKRYDPEAERSLAHQKYKLDWYDEDSYFGFILKNPKRVQRASSTQPSFDFDRETIYFSAGEDQEMLTAFAFLRFREETGHPFRIINVVSGNKTAIGAAVRIAPYAFHWAVVTIAGAYEEKAVGDILTRPVLSEMTAQEADVLCRIYLDALQRTEGELSAADWFSPRNFAGFAAGVLPKLISHLCCKCTLLVLDEILQALLRIYRSDCRLNYKKVEELMTRLMKAFTEEQKRERIPILLEFPLLYDERVTRRDFPDPFMFISVRGRRFKSSPEVIPDTEKLFIRAQRSDQEEERAAALRRLAILSLADLLTAEQNYRLGEMLWENGLLRLEGFSRTFCLALPHPEGIKPFEAIKDALLEDLRIRSEKQGNSLSFGDTFFDELNIAVKHGVFTAGEMSILLSHCLHEQKQLVYYLGNDTFGTAGMAQPQIYRLSMTLVYLFLYAEGWNYTDTERGHMEEILKGFRENRFINPALEILWAREYGQGVNEKDLIVSCLLKGSYYEKLSAYETVMLTVHNKLGEIPPFVLAEEIRLEVFALITQQILWRNGERLNSALHVMADLIRYAPELLSLEMEKSLLIGLECLLDETRITGGDSVETATQKGNIRRAAAKLAREMVRKYATGEGEEWLPPALLRWKETYTNPDEFVEIRG